MQNEIFLAFDKIAPRAITWSNWNFGGGSRLPMLSVYKVMGMENMNMRDEMLDLENVVAVHATR